AGVLLRHGKGEFAAGQEAGFLAIDRDQGGLGQNLQEILRLERLDHRTQMDLRVEEEHVEYVRYRRGSGEWGTRSLIGDGPYAGDSAELAGGGGADGVSGAGRKQVEARLGEGGAVHFSKLDFEKHFFRPDGAEGQHVHYILGIRRGE